MKEQEYTLLVQAHGICITGGSAVGIFYGIQTLRQIIEQCRMLYSVYNYCGSAENFAPGILSRCDKRKDSDDGLPEKAGRSHGILQTEPVTALYGAYLFCSGDFLRFGEMIRH